MMLCLNLSDVAIIAVNGVNYSCIIYNISKSEAFSLKGCQLTKFCEIIEILMNLQIRVKERPKSCYCWEKKSWLQFATDSLYIAHITHINILFCEIGKYYPNKVYLFLDGFRCLFDNSL